MGLSVLRSIRRITFLLLAIIPLSALVMTWSSTANACGGPEYYDIDSPMGGPDDLFRSLTEYWDYYESYTAAELHFQYPFKVDPRYKKAIESPRRPDMNEFYLALRSHDFEKADKEARTIIEEIIDMPSSSANEYQNELIWSLEFIEIASSVDGYARNVVMDALTANAFPEQIAKLPQPVQDALAVRGISRGSVEKFLEENPETPRTPTFRFVAMQMKFKREIPDGWISEIQKEVPAEKWREFEGLADEWLKDYPEHPLADLVRFWKDRIYYLEGRYDLMWKNLLDIYPRHMPRLVKEMGFVGGFPDEMMDSVPDPLLTTALLSWKDVTPEKWTRLWKLSEKNLPEPWAVNLQERLLYQASD